MPHCSLFGLGDHFEMIEFADRLSSLSPEKRALLEQRLAAQNAAQPRTDSDRRDEAELSTAVAVVGMACQFPGADDLAQYWDIVLGGRIQAKVIPNHRWDVEGLFDAAPETPGRMSTKWACMVDDIDQFDPMHFGIAPREASRMDPQQRMLLQNSLRAMEHAGIDPIALSRGKTGVFMGVGQTDYSRVMSQFDNSLFALDAHCGTGGAMSICANRLSYVFNFTGPSLVIDTACSSALVAVHDAVHSLRRGECDAALAGGVNVCLSPDAFVSLSKARMLSPNGACRPFDARADGYVRGEGCGVVVLKRLSDATAAGDNVLAVIRGTAVNHGGRTSGISAPSGDAQQRVINDALLDAQVSADQIGYVEAHGTGTPLGDPIEVETLTKIFKLDPDPTKKNGDVFLTSVKANIGHTEIAAGIAGLIKTILIMNSGTIPPQAGLEELNPYLSLDDSRIKIPRVATAWNTDTVRTAGVSSFGFGGTNSHVIIQSAATNGDQAAANRNPIGEESGVKSSVAAFPNILPLSARGDDTLQRSASEFSHQIADANFDAADLANVCYTAGAGRTHHDVRAAVVADDTDAMIRGLDRLSNIDRDKSATSPAADQKSGPVQSNSVGKPMLRESIVTVHQGRRPSTDPIIAGMFTGQGSQYPTMAMGLYEAGGVFKTVLDQCEEIVGDIRGESLLAIIRGDVTGDGGSSLLHQTNWTQPALVSIEYALFRFWESIGIQPDILIGHSVGEITAAIAAGVLDLQSGLKLICRRSELMHSLPTGGAMAVLFADGQMIQPHIEKYADCVAVAALNGPENTTISGTEAMVARIVQAAQRDGVVAKMLEVSHAFHSPLMHPILEEMESFALQFDYARPQIPIVSNLTGQLMTATSEESYDGKYWRDHIRQPVQFAGGVDRLIEEDVDLMIEMGPSATLLSMARRCRPKAKVTMVPSLRSGQNDRRFIAEAIGKTYAAGTTVDWAGLHRQFSSNNPRRISVPGYPLTKKRYWFEPEHATKHFMDLIVGTSHVSPLLGTPSDRPGSIAFESRLTDYMPTHLTDHRVKGECVIPGSALVEIALAAAAEVFDDSPARVQSISITKALFLSDRTVQLLTSIHGQSANSRDFEIHSRPVDASDDESWQLHATGRIAPAEHAGVADDQDTKDGETDDAKIGDPIVSFKFGVDVDPDAVRSRQNRLLDRAEFYNEVADRGLDYGPRFRIVDALYRCPDEVWCETTICQNVIEDATKYVIHPVIGDGCLQAITGVVPLEADGSFCPDLYLPVSMGNVEVAPTMAMDEAVRRSGGKLNYYVRRTSPPTGPAPDFVEADIQIMTPDGHVLATFQAVRIQKVSSSARNNDVPSRWLYNVKWQSLAPENESSDGRGQVTETETAASLLSTIVIAGHDSIVDRIGGDTVIEVHPGNASAVLKSVKKWAGSLAVGTEARVVVALGLDARYRDNAQDAASLAKCESIWTDVFRVLADLMWVEFDSKSSVWLLTRGARSVQHDNYTATDTTVDPGQTPLVGIAQVATQEMRQSNLRVVDLDPSADDDSSWKNLQSIFADAGDEPMIAIRDGHHFVPRLKRDAGATGPPALSSTAPRDSAFRLRLGEGNTIDSMGFETLARSRPSADQVEVAIHATGLNFSDVLKSLGLYPGITDDVVPLGLEISGVISAVGDEVTHLNVGDEVFGIVPHGFASHCITSAAGLVAKPADLDHDEAAAIPLAYLTAEYCLRRVANLQPGETVLIHAGAGGVGLAAIQIAQNIGATIYATAGSDTKREFLRDLGVELVMNSRTTEFADQIDLHTGGRGVDVVLNSLPGDAIERSLQSLAAYGRFVEIGKIDIYSNRAIGLSPFQDNLSYTAVDLDRLFRQRPAVASSLLNEIAERFDNGDYQVGQITLFTIDQVVDAFRFMSQRKNIGKVVVTIDQDDFQIAQPTIASETSQERVIRGDASYLVTGGLGALGMATAKWLVEQGAGGVVLMSRRQCDDATRKAIDQWRGDFTRVHTVAADVADSQSLTSAIESLPAELPPLKGVFHAAGVLRDKLLNQMSDEDFAFVLPAKVDGTVNLAAATRDLNLDFTVLFSSVSAVLGTAGQSNYGAANAFMDGWAEQQSAAGRRTIAINWGAFDGSGMAADLAETMRAHGVELLPTATSLAMMSDLIRSGRSRATVFRADWDRFGSLLRGMMSGDLKYRLIDDLAQSDHEGSGAAADTMAIRDELSTLDPETLADRLHSYFAGELSEIMGIDPTQIDASTTLTSLGMDSLMAMELGNKMQRALDVELPMSIYLQGPTVDRLVQYVSSTVAERSAADRGESNSGGDEV